MKTKLISVALVLAIAQPSFASTQESQRDPDGFSVINEAGKALGTDRPELRPDARETNNFLQTTASAIEEFTGIKTKKYGSYIDAFFGLFKRKKKKDQVEDAIAQSEESAGTSGSGSSQNIVNTSEIEETIGAAGIADPEEVEKAIAQLISVPTGSGGAFAAPVVAVVQTFTRAAKLQLAQQANESKLGKEGQELTAQRNEELAKAVEASNSIANEMETVKATQDAIKMQGKQASLQAAIAQLGVQETQQIRLDQLSGNQALYEVQDLLAKRDFADTIDQATQRIGVLKGAHNFSGAFAVGGED